SEVFCGTVRDNLVLGAAQADDAQLVDAVVRSGADIFLSRDAAGFDLPVGERGSRLSGGQRSLLVLARALVSPSKLLFLDEPTGAMDTQTELYFVEHLKTALAPDQTLIVATHRHNMLSIVDRLIVVDAGRIIADGPRDEGGQAKLINAALPFASEPVSAARAFAIDGSDLDHQRAVLCLTQAVYYEAGFEPLEGRRAVAQVVLNRLRHPAFPKSVCGVVYQGAATGVCQFTFVCDGALYRAPALGAWGEAEAVARAALA